MAKKRVEQPADDEQDEVEYSDVEPEVVEETIDFGDNEPTVYEGGVAKLPDSWYEKPTITKPGGAAVSLDTDERTYRVSFALPYGVLVALIDPMHSDADTEAAFELFLVKLDNTPTTLGYLVLSGIDQTAIRHKMLAAWREQHNRGVDSDKTGFKKAE